MKECMANQQIVDWFLNKYDTGESIDQRTIDLLAKALRKKGKGRPAHKMTPITILALYELCTAALITEYMDTKDESTIRKAIRKAKKEGYTTVRFDNYIDENGKPLIYAKGKLSSTKSRQIFILSPGVPILYCFNFWLDEKNKLVCSLLKQ